VLLSEDGARSWQGLKAILQKLLRRFEDDGFTPRVEILPAELLGTITLGNRWRSTNPRDQREKRDLWRYVARKISEPGGFVVFHYDGDMPWMARSSAQARAQFERELRLRVRQVLAGHTDGGELDRRLARLIECVPYYSIEAWTYQATERATELCKKYYDGADVGKFEHWQVHRAELDDVKQPKKKTCLKDEHNDDLGKHVPVWEVEQARCSLSAFISELRLCGDLSDAVAHRVDDR
jgi:hypothetical protein